MIASLAYYYFDKLSRGEICVANFMPPADGASQGTIFGIKNTVFMTIDCFMP